jgi:hypothetical protein
MRYGHLRSDVEVSGNFLASIMQGFGVYHSLAMKYLSTHGLCVHVAGKETPVDTTRWYPLVNCLKAFDVIMEQIGHNIMFDIGLSVPKNARFPPAIKDIDSAMQSLDIAYHMNHRQGGVPMFNPATGKMLIGIGHYGYRRLSSKQKIISVCDNPYPCRFDLGILTAMAKRFESRALIIHDDEKPCRNKDGANCTYLISW